MKELSKKELKEQYKNRVVIGGIYVIKCSGTADFWIRATTDLQSSKNRFQYSVSMNTSPENSMLRAWNQYGASHFTFEVLEEIEKQKTQTSREFSEDVNLLLELWKEKLMEEYNGDE